MVNEIFYCSRCQSRLFGNQFQKGTAFRIGDNISCTNCLGEMIAPLSLQQQEAILLQVRALQNQSGTPPADGGDFFEVDSSPQVPPESGDFFEVDSPESPKSTSKRVPAVTRPVAVGASTAASRPSSSQHVGLILLLGLLGIVATMGALHFLNPEDSWLTPAPPPPPPIVRTPVPPEPKPKPASVGPSTTSLAASREDQARAAFESAKEFVKANPRNLTEQIDLFKKATFTADGTSIAEQVKQEFAKLRQAHKGIIAAELAAIDADVKAGVEKEEFKRVNDLLEQASKRHTAIGDWTQAIDIKLRDVSQAAWKVFVPIRDKATEARRRNAEDEVKAGTDRVAKWGVAHFISDLERALSAARTANPAATADPKPAGEIKPLTEEGKAYQPRWLEAMALAAVRDYEAATATLDKAVAAIKEAALKTEAQADQQTLKLVQSVHADALQAIAQWPAGTRISIEFLDDTLSPELVNESFVRADASTVVVTKGGAPLAIEASEITAKSLSHLYRKRAGNKGDADARAAALLCLFEGDVAGARSHFSGTGDEIPFKYWSLASKIAEGRSPASESARREIQARRLYSNAERAYPDLKARAAAIQEFRQLLNDYPDTSIVKRRRAQIIARRDGAKDWIFMADDLAASGVFKPGKSAKYGPVWTSMADTDPAKGGKNFIDVSFYGLQDTAYKCWVHVGGCCAEVFSFFYQASDLTWINPDTKEVVQVDPGGNLSLPVRHSIMFLKKYHIEHGGPKEAKRWEWVQVTLPKYSQSGVKTVRIHSEQKGFGVAYAVVSSTRSNAPGEGEMKAWLKKPETPEDPAPFAPGPAAVQPPERDASLIGHWKLDEGGRTAFDSSGNDNTGILVNEPVRGDGKLGGALVLDGKDRHVNIPNSPALDALQDGNYSIAFWFKPHAKPAKADDGFALVVKSAYREGLVYTAEQKFALDHWLSGNAGATAVTPGTFAPGTFHHVVGVVSRGEGAVRIYVDGKLEATAGFAPNTAGRGFGSEPWRIGIANPAAAPKWAANGTLDDVRIYNRALGANDVRIIAGAKPK